MKAGEYYVSVQVAPSFDQNENEVDPIPTSSPSPHSNFEHLLTLMAEEASSPLSSVDDRSSESADEQEEKVTEVEESKDVEEVNEGGSQPTLDQRKAKMEELRKRMVCTILLLTIFA